MTNAKPPDDGSETNETAVSHPPRQLCASPEETQALGARFAVEAGSSVVISLEGPLGAGKTQFVKGFVAARGHDGEVSSPTFTLVHEYADGTIAHFDWYRLDEAEDVLGLGWDDYLAEGGALLVEWGDNFPDLLPTGAWRVRFEILGDSRVVSWESAR
jgi:tRNA threonylcarbamoyladenosine biosynthesis protein TsaE